MDWLTVFDPDPLWYQICLHTVTVISTPIFFLGLYCVFRQSNSVNKPFQRLLGSSMVFSYLSQLVISTGTIPVIILPMTGGYPIGFFTDLGVPTYMQLLIVFHVVLAVVLFTLLLFFNRHQALAPLPAVFHYLFIIGFILMTIIIPLIINTILVVNLDPLQDKQHFLKKYPELVKQISNFWDDVVLMIDPSRNITLIFVNIYYLVVANTAIICITFFVSRIKFHLNTNMMSATTKAMHRAFVKSLVIQSAVHYMLILIPVVFLFCGFLFEWEVPGLSSVVFSCLALSDPSGIVSLIISNKEYRKCTVQLICNSKKKLASFTHRTDVSSIMVVPSSQQPSRNHVTLNE